MAVASCSVVAAAVAVTAASVESIIQKVVNHVHIIVTKRAKNNGKMIFPHTEAACTPTHSVGKIKNEKNENTLMGKNHSMFSMFMANVTREKLQLVSLCGC